MVFALFRGKRLRCDEVLVCNFAREDSAQSTAGVFCEFSKIFRATIC